MSSRNGFTVAEILVIIALIAILAGIAVAGFSGLQKDARNKERESDIAILRTSLEEFYEKNGYYPPEENVTGSGSVGFVTRTLNVPPSAIIAPNSSPGTDNSIQTAASVQADTTLEKNSYVYTPALSVTAGGEVDTVCTDASDKCTAYELLYKQEAISSGDQEDVEIKSKYGW